MRVDSSSTPSAASVTQADATAPRATARAAAASAAAAPVAAPVATTAASAAGSFVMTDQLAQLVAAVRNSPSVRADAVDAASTKLASGELFSPQAAADSALAMLLNVPPPPDLMPDS